MALRAIWQQVEGALLSAQLCTQARNCAAQLCALLTNAVTAHPLAVRAALAHTGVAESGSEEEKEEKEEGEEEKEEEKEGGSSKHTRRRRRWRNAALAGKWQSTAATRRCSRRRKRGESGCNQRTSWSQKRKMEHNVRKSGSDFALLVEKDQM